MIQRINDITRIYGRTGLYASPYDERDYKFKNLVPVGAVEIPESYETPELDFVYDQGNSQMCAACAYNYIRYLQEKDEEQSELDSPFNPVFNYANRPKGEDFEGMYLRSVCKKGKDGSVPNSTSKIPFLYGSYIKCKNYLNSRREELLEMAKPFAISSYYQCTSREQVQTAILTTKAVIGGLFIFNSLLKPEKGYVKYNKNRDLKNYGGHAIVLVGWKHEKGKFYWRLQNSWGSNWGENGRVWIPAEYPWLENPYALVDMVTETKWKDYQLKYKSNDKL